jgi:ABC-type phosphate/phosphonate transport system ATPase subunit
MTALSGLKLTAAAKPQQISGVQLRRNKMAKRIWEQVELAKAQQAGTTFAPTRFRTVVENDTGIRKQIETHKRVKQWWFITDTGKLAITLRYGSKVIELAKGKSAVEIANEKELVPVLETLKGAVLAGELDQQIDAAANKLREGFER